MATKQKRKFYVTFCAPDPVPGIGDLNRKYTIIKAPTKADAENIARMRYPAYAIFRVITEYIFYWEVSCFGFEHFETLSIKDKNLEVKQILKSTSKIGA